MTRRQYIADRLRTFALLCWPVAILGLAALMLTAKYGSPRAAFLAAGIMAVVMIPTSITLYIRVTCPECGGNVYHLVNFSGSPLFPMPKRVRFCPLCGCNLDEEIGSEQPPAN